MKETEEATRALRRKIDASPKREDFEREFGKGRVKDEKDGSWTLTLHDRDEIKKAHQMQNQLRRVEVERGEQVQAKWDGKREKLQRPDGRLVDIPDELVDQAKGNGLRPVGRNKKSAVGYFALSSSMQGYEQGPDGLWFVWNDGWEPTALWTRDKDLAEKQRDPDGNVWVRHEGEWVLESEVG
jgi:hypothetical protein